MSFSATLSGRPTLPFSCCVHKSFLHVCIYIACPGNRFISTIFLDSMWMNVNNMNVEVAQSCPTLCFPMAYNSPWNSPGQNTGVGSCSLLHGIFPTQESTRGLLRCRRILYQLSYQGRSCICINIQYLIVSFWLTSLCITGSRFIHLTRTDSNTVLFMAE